VVREEATPVREVRLQEALHMDHVLTEEGGIGECFGWLRGRTTQNASGRDEGERGEGTDTKRGAEGEACPGEEPVAQGEGNQHHRRQQQHCLEVGEDRGPEREGKDGDPPWGWAIPHDAQERPDQGQDERLQ
jgi:hypothetical protein